MMPHDAAKLIIVTPSFRTLDEATHTFDRAFFEALPEGVVYKNEQDDSPKEIEFLLRAPELPIDDYLRLAMMLAHQGLPLRLHGVRSDRLARRLGKAHVRLHLPAREVQEAATMANHFNSAAVHNHDELLAARAIGCTTFLIAPVFPVEGKGPPLGPSGLASLLVHRRYGERFVALGGIDPTNAAVCFELGVDAVAIRTCFWASSDRCAVLRALMATATK